MSFFNNTSFNEMLRDPASVGEGGAVKRIDEKSLFIINDIELVIPPTNIQVHKEDMYYNHKTLRTKHSTKVASGHGFCQVAINCIFTPDLLLHLHRLIVEIKCSPFIWVENMFIRQSIVPDWDLTRFMGFVVSSFHVNTVPGLPGTFNVRMDLKWFNYQPYTPNFLFKKDFLTLPMKHGNDDFCQKTIPVIVGKNLKRQQVPLVLSSKVMKKYFRDVPHLENQSFDELLASSGDNISLENSINKFSGVLMDGQQLPSYIMPSVPCIPIESHIYKRYINDRQLESLMVNFGIDVFEDYESIKKTDDFSRYTVGVSVSDVNKYKYRYVESFHLGNDHVKTSILKRMHSWHSWFNIRFNEFNKVVWPSFVERVKKKVAQEHLMNNIGLDYSYKGAIKDVSKAAEAAAMRDTSLNWNDTTTTVELRRSSGDKNVSYTGHHKRLASVKQWYDNRNKLFPPLGSLNDRSMQPFINSGFGNRKSSGKWRQHEGIDVVFTNDDKPKAAATPTDVNAVLAEGKLIAKSITKDGAAELKKWVKNRKYKGLTFTGWVEAVNSGNARTVEAPQANSAQWSEVKDLLSNRKMIWPLYAVSSGIVTRVKYGKGYGNQVEITHSGNGEDKFVTKSAHMSFVWVGKNEKVEQGQIIGFVGATGDVTGPHLHFEIRVSNTSVSNKLVPPFPFLSFEFTPKKETPKPGSKISADNFSREDFEVKSEGDYRGTGFDNLSEAENLIFATFVSAYNNMVNAGWRTYKKRGERENIFYKNVSLGLSNLSSIMEEKIRQGDANQLIENTIATSRLLQDDKSVGALNTAQARQRKALGGIELIDQATIITAASASFSNIIASIPIVGHEFPTTQHMGSMEPSYNFEIQFINTVNPSELPASGKALNRVLSQLQTNARDYREVPDGHAFSLDCFLTRLMGSFSVDDVRIGYDKDDPTFAQKRGQLSFIPTEIVPRCNVGRSSISNVEGSPGRYLMNLQVSETNPFFVEEIKVLKSQPAASLNDTTSYTEVLKRLYNINSYMTDAGYTALVLSLLDKGKMSEETLDDTTSYGLNTFDEDGESFVVGSEDVLSDVSAIGGYFASDSAYSFSEKNINSSLNLEDKIRGQIGTEANSYLLSNNVGNLFHRHEPRKGEQGWNAESILKGTTLWENVEESDGLMFVSNTEVDDFYRKNPDFANSKTSTGEGSIGSLPIILKSLDNIMQRMRSTVAEEAAGGLSSDLVSQALYDTDQWAVSHNGSYVYGNNASVDLLFRSPSMWKNHIFWMYKYLREKVVDDRESDPIDGALVWTKDQVDDYFESIHFHGLYRGLDGEGEVVHEGGSDKNVDFFVSTSVVTTVSDGENTHAQRYHSMPQYVNRKYTDYQSWNASVSEVSTDTVLAAMYGDSSKSIEAQKTEYRDAFNFWDPLDLIEFYKFDFASDSYVFVDKATFFDTDISDFNDGEFMKYYIKIKDAQTWINTRFGKGTSGSGVADIPIVGQIRGEDWQFKGEVEEHPNIYSWFLKVDISDAFDVLELDSKAKGEFIEIHTIPLFGKIIDFAFSRQLEGKTEAVTVWDFWLGTYFETPEYENWAYGWGRKDEPTEIYELFNEFDNKVFNSIFATYLDFANNYVPNNTITFDGSEQEQNQVEASSDTIEDVKGYWYIYYQDKDFITNQINTIPNMTHNTSDLLSGTNNSFVNGFGTMIDGNGGFSSIGNLIPDVEGGFKTLDDGTMVYNNARKEGWYGHAGGFYGASESELTRKKDIFLERRKEMWYAYLVSLNENGLETAVGDIAINNTFPLLKAYAGMRFTLEAQKENGGENKFLAFSGMERVFALFAQWLIEPRLINEMPLDMIYGNAGNDVVMEYWLPGGVASGISSFETAGFGSMASQVAGYGQAGAITFDALLLAKGMGSTGMGTTSLSSIVGVGLPGPAGVGGGMGSFSAYTGASSMGGAAFNFFKTGGWYLGIASVASTVPNTIGHGANAIRYAAGSDVLETTGKAGSNTWDRTSQAKVNATSSTIDPENSATADYYNRNGSGRYGGFEEEWQPFWSTLHKGYVTERSASTIETLLRHGYDNVTKGPGDLMLSEQQFLELNSRRVKRPFDFNKALRECDEIYNDASMPNSKAARCAYEKEAEYNARWADFDQEKEDATWAKIQAYAKAQYSQEWKGWGSMKDPRTDRSILKHSNIPSYTDVKMEKQKLAIFSAELKALVETVLRNREICTALDLPYKSSVYVPASEKYVGSSCYPDLDLPDHPFYDQSNMEMDPMFYMWDIYTDGQAQLNKHLLDEVDKNAKIYLEASYRHLKAMQNGKISVNPLTSDSTGMPVGESGSKLQYDPEASDLVKFPSNIETKADGNVEITYTKLGNTSTPFFMGSGETANDVGLTEAQKEILIDDLKATEDPGVTKYKFGVGADLGCTWQLNTRPQIVRQRIAIYNYLRFCSRDADRIINKPTLAYLSDFSGSLMQAGVDSLYTAAGMPFGVDTSMVYDGVTGVASPTDAWSGFTDVPDTNIDQLTPILRPSVAAMEGKYYHEYNEFHNNYQDLQAKVDSIESMFGNGAGYTGELIEGTKENSAEIEEMLNDIKLRGVGDQSNYNQAFNLEALSNLARASCVDIFSQRKKMSRALPTFKLFFIEEDEMESRFLNLDDFHSFNGVKSFTVNRDRESPADTAVISLQNVAGTLDGTRQGAIVDVDYFNKKRAARAVRLENKRRAQEDPAIPSADSGSESIRNESSQPFSAIVMRPGINIQLRAGYSNNPDYLEVLISGRVTDISWGGAGDSCEIVVQSFGTELIQQIKGLTDDVPTYYATHQLLGDMMLSPELKHFGRWESGRTFQYGEAQDMRLDFYKYKEKVAPSTMTGIQEYGQVIFDNGMYIAVGAVALAALRFKGFSQGLSRAGLAAQDVGAFSWNGIRGGQWLKTLGLTGQAFLNTRYTSLLSMARLGSTRVNQVIAPSFRTATGQEVLLKALNSIGKAGAETGKLLIHLGDDVLKNISHLMNRISSARETVRTLGKDGMPPALSRSILEGLMDIPQAAAFKNMPVWNNLTKSSKVLLQSLQEGVVLTRAQTAELTRIVNATENLMVVLASRPSGAQAVFLEGWRAAGYWNATKLVAGDVVSAIFAPGAIFFKTALLYLGFNKVSNGLTANLREYREAMERWFTKELVYFKMNPCDDNLYPPNPAFYMHMIPDKTNSLWDQIEFTFLYAFSGDADQSYNDVLTKWKTSNPLLYLKRVTTADCVYFLNSNTIWDIFHEMTLRHPGYIYGAVPYGNEFRYTMFFGVPSQRYWSKGVSGGFIRRMNSVRDHLTTRIKNSDEVKAMHERMYGSSAYSKQDFDPNSEANVELYNNYVNQAILAQKQSATQFMRSTYDSNIKGTKYEYYSPLDSLSDKYTIDGQYWLEYKGSGIEGLANVDWEGGKTMLAHFYLSEQYKDNKQGDADYEIAKGDHIDSIKKMTKNEDINNACEKFTYTHGIPLQALTEWLNHDFMLYGIKEDGEQIWYQAWKEDASEEVNSFLEENSVDFYPLDQAGFQVAMEDIKEATELGTGGDYADLEDYITNINISTFRSRLLAEYLNGLEQRFVPFRRYHLIRSKNNLVSNNLTVSLKNCVNSVNVFYEKASADGVASEKSVFMKASSAIADESLITENLTEYTTNVRSHAMALRYGQGRLLYGMRAMYGGEIMVLGDARMKPWDICFLFDQYNEMSGPIEIKSVTHMFSFETGFLTEIVPNAVVIANESSSWPVLEALKVYVAAAMDVENGSNDDVDSIHKLTAKTKSDGLYQSMQAKEGQRNKLVEALHEMSEQTSDELGTLEAGTFWQRMGMKKPPDASVKFDGYNLSFGTSDFMIKRYSELIKQELITYERPDEDGKSRAKIDTRKILEELFDTQDISSKAGPFAEAYSVDDLNNGIVDSVDTLFGLGVGYYLGKQAMNPFSGGWDDVAMKTAGLGTMGVAMLGLVSKSKLGAWMPGLIGTALYGSGTINQTITNYDTVTDRFSASYLLGAPVIFSKLMESEAVTVIPVVKAGVPMLAGISTRNPLSFWKSALGDIVQAADDTFKGIFDNYRETQAMGTAFWNQVIARNEERKNDPGIKHLRESGGINNIINKEGY